ncbi:MAG: putative Type IV pilus pilin [Parcubacteria bacterium C7867-006]|nr:MAG: putative Type IV pilus pilin [Parcubacteria bacterium C7867-006]
MIKTIRKNNKGFTLVELMVSLSVFITVMVISTGSILSVIDANRKSQSLRSVMDNLNYTLESMTRNIRFGTAYHCDITQGISSSPLDCSGGASSMAVTSSAGTLVTYRLDNGRIARATNCVGGTVGCTEYYMTGSDVTITAMNFFVSGSATYGGGSNLYQPRAIIVISGYVGSKQTSRSTFTIETTVSQRMFDSQ